MPDCIDFIPCPPDLLFYIDTGWVYSSMLTAQVHKTTFYLLHYGGPTPKPLFAFSNSRHVEKLNKGQLKGWVNQKKALKDSGKSKDLVIKYIDGNGKRRYKGSSELRSSECGSYFLEALALCTYLFHCWVMQLPKTCKAQAV